MTLSPPGPCPSSHPHCGLFLADPLLQPFVVHCPAGEKLKQLIALRTSTRYLDRLAAGLHQRAGQEAKFLRWAGIACGCCSACLQRSWKAAAAGGASGDLACSSAVHIDREEQRRAAAGQSALQAQPVSRCAHLLWSDRACFLLQGGGGCGAAAGRDPAAADGRFGWVTPTMLQPLCSQRWASMWLVEPLAGCWYTLVRMSVQLMAVT